MYGLSVHTVKISPAHTVLLIFKEHLPYFQRSTKHFDTNSYCFTFMVRGPLLMLLDVYMCSIKDCNSNIFLELIFPSRINATYVYRYRYI
jgi:hypothetical protein